MSGHVAGVLFTRPKYPSPGRTLRANGVERWVFGIERWVFGIERWVSRVDRENLSQSPGSNAACVIEIVTLTSEYTVAARINRTKV